MADPAPASEDTAAMGRRLVETFGQGWQRTDPQALLSVFTPDAVFLESPFAQPMTGIAAIRDYWQDLSFHQSEVRFTFGEVFVAGPWFGVEFRVTFRRRRTGEPVDARGGMFCETDAGRVKEMRLYWHRRVGGREMLDR